MKTKAILLLTSIAVVSVAAFAQAPSPDNGKIVFDNWCVHCHGASSTGALPGTAALALKYNDTLPPVLEERTDLTPEFVRTVVRNGLISMPRTRKTEVSDAELEDIVAYLTDGT